MESGYSRGIDSKLVSYLRDESKANSIVLFGSKAREDEDEFSDLDILVVSDFVEETDALSCSQNLRSKIPKALLPRETWLSLMVYSRKEFEDMCRRGSLFAAHVLREGIVLYDDGFYGNLKQEEFRLSREELLLSLKILRERLTITDDLSKYNNYYIRCLANLFVISKNLAIVGLALRGKLVFNKKRALDELSNLYPEHRFELNRLFELKPFFLRNSKGLKVNLPFEPNDCEEVINELRDDLKELITEVAENE